MEYYLTIRKNEAPVHAITWINPENIMLNKRSHTQMTTYYMIPFGEMSRLGKSIGAVSRYSGFQGLGLLRNKE